MAMNLLKRFPNQTKMTKKGVKKRKKPTKKDKPKKKKETKKIELDKDKLEKIIKVGSEDKGVVRSNRFVPALDSPAPTSPGLESIQIPRAQQPTNLEQGLPAETQEKKDENPTESAEISQRAYVEMSAARGEPKYLTSQEQMTREPRIIRPPVLTPTSMRTRQQPRFFPEQQFRIRTETEELAMQQAQDTGHSEHYVTDIKNIMAERAQEFEDKRKYKAHPGA